MNNKDIPSATNLVVFYWLMLLTIMVFIMIAIGGLTRLTNSGLSIVDWEPVMGILPPFYHSDWLESFNKYKQSPEYLIVNSSMVLDEFKYIFWWEWAHRFFARLIGLVFIIPMIIFIIKKKISKRMAYGLFLLVIFGFFQAIVGWWMVKSGLNKNPYVSSYRLAFHLSNAVIILAIILWLSLNSLSSLKISFWPKKKLEFLTFYLITLLLVTIISGAFMAGSNAGQSFNTYPLMNGVFLPNDYFIEGSIVKNFFENIVAINFNHRWLATFTFVIIISFAAYLYFNKNFKDYKLNLSLIFLFGCVQFFLGILTLLSNVEILLASMHQINSMFFFSSLIFFYHSIKKKG